MPFVHIVMEPRDDESRHRIAREVADAMAEGTNNSLDGIQMIFHEVPRPGYARGLSLASRRPRRTDAPGPVRADHVAISRLKVLDEEGYLAHRRDYVNPALAAQEGFVSTMLLRTDSDHEYWVLNKWLSKEHAEAWSAGSASNELDERAKSTVRGFERLDRRGAALVHQVFGPNGGKVLDR